MPSNYKSTGVPNLFLDEKTGVFYARKKIKGDTYYRALGKQKTAAKDKLADKLKEIRQSVPTQETKGSLTRSSTFGEAVELYRHKVIHKVGSAANTIETSLRPLARIQQTYPELFEIQLRRVTLEMLVSYTDDFKRGKFPYRPKNAKSTVAGNSASTVNKIINCLRAVFEIAVTKHVLTQNPAKDIEEAKEEPKLLNLPTKEQFRDLVEHVRLTAGRGRMCGDLIEGLAYSGMRLGEAGRVRWMDLDFERRLMKVYGTKTYTSMRHIPMSKSFVELVQGIRERRTKLYGEPKPKDEVFEAKSALTSLAKASVHVGMEKMVHHDLRDYFATTCIERNVDIPTVAKWLGHDDGGVLAMETYGHIRPDHSIVSGKPATASPVESPRV